MAYKKQDFSFGKFFKFEEEGDTLEGEWLGVKEGKYGKNGVVKTDDGTRLSFSLTTVLADLEFIDPGKKIKLVLTGFQKGKFPNPMKVFDVFIDDGLAGKSEAPATKQKGKIEDDEVPF